MTTVSPVATVPAANRNAVNATQNQFLKLLVTQMKNQDPLNPLENAEVTSQLAQLSTVDGINKLNATLQTLSTAYAESRSLQAASLVGRDVLAPGASLKLGNGVAIGGIELSQPADRVIVTITDKAGKVQQSIDLGPQEAGVVTFQWDGIRDNGMPASEGAYAFDVRALLGSAEVKADKLSYAKVGSVTLGSQDTRLNTPELGAIALSQIKQVF